MITITSCVKRFENVKVGMTTSQLKDVVGSPDSIRNDFFAEVWFYETHLVSVSCDTVTLIRNKAEIQAEVRDMQKEIDRLKAKGY